MRSALPVFREEAAWYVTLAAQTQAVECAIQAMHTHLQEALSNNACPRVIRHGRVSGDPDLILHPPRLTDPSLVMEVALVVKGRANSRSKRTR